MAEYHGSNGAVAIKTADGEWRDLGPAVMAVMPPIASATEVFAEIGVLAGTVTGTFHLHHKAWNAMCRVLNVPYLIVVAQPSTPLRRRKHGGRWQAYRDVRANWQKVRYD